MKKQKNDGMSKTTTIFSMGVKDTPLKFFSSVGESKTPLEFLCVCVCFLKKFLKNFLEWLKWFFTL